MKKLLILILVLVMFFTSNSVFANNGLDTYTNEKGLFGLKDNQGNIVVEAEYKKLIRVGSSSWLVLRKNRYGLIDNEGFYLVEPKYIHAERILGKYVKLGNYHDFGLYSETGDIILPAMYSSIDLLYGNMFLTCMKYKYGVVDFDGNILLANEFDDIYMPSKTSMRILYKGEWYEFEKISSDKIELAENSKRVTIDDQHFTFTKLMADTGVVSGYYAVSATDYVLKIISSISPAYEQTIDHLMLSHGAETVNIFMNPTWIVKFPFVYYKKYINNFRAPNNGPLSPIKQDLQRKLAN